MFLYPVVGTAPQLGSLPPLVALSSIPLVSSIPATSVVYSTTTVPITSPSVSTPYTLPLAPTEISSNPGTVLQSTSPSHVSLSLSTEPIPTRLAQRILTGQFVEMRDLLGDNIALTQHFETMQSQFPTALLPATSRPRLREVTTLSSWIYCFLMYLAVRTVDQATRDRLIYARLVIREALRHGGRDGWTTTGYSANRLPWTRPSLGTPSMPLSWHPPSSASDRAEACFVPHARGVTTSQASALWRTSALVTSGGPTTPPEWEPSRRDYLFLVERGELYLPRVLLLSAHLCHLS